MTEFECRPTHPPSDLFQLGIGPVMWDKLLERDILYSDDLLSLTPQQLVAERGVSRADVKTLRELLAERGCYLSGDAPKWQRRRLVSSKDVSVAWDIALPSNAGEGVVYFVHNPLSDRIKIGYTKTLGSRVADLETGAGVELTLIAALVGEHCDERLLHGHFKAHRLFREWFAFTPVSDWLQTVQPQSIVNLAGSRAVFREWKI